MWRRETQRKPFPFVVPAIALVAGYLVRTVQEGMECSACLARIRKPGPTDTSDRLILHQDRGGLIYPSKLFLDAVKNMKLFFDSAPVQDLNHPLKALVDAAAPTLALMEPFSCPGEETHGLLMGTIVAKKFFKPLLTNVAQGVTDVLDLFKYRACKPLKRKLLKM